MDLNPICHHASPARKIEMLIFGLGSTSYDWLGWLMDLNPICHSSPARKMKCSFLDYVQLLMISQAGQWTQTPSATPLQPKEWNAHFLIAFNFWWSAGMVNGLKPHPPPLTSQKNEMLMLLDYVQLLLIDQAGQWTQTQSSYPSPAKKMKCSFLDYVHFWWSAGLVDGLEPHPPPLSSQKYEMLIFGLRSTCDVGQAGWWTWSPSATSSAAKKMKGSFWDYAQLLMIAWAGRWTRTPSTMPLQPKNWNAHLWITFSFWCWLGWLMDSNPMQPPLSSQKYEMLVFGLCSTSVDQPGLVNGLDTPSTTPLQPEKWNAHFWIMFNFWWLGWAGWWTRHPIHHPSPARKMKCLFLDYVQLLMLVRLVDVLEPHPPLLLQPEKWNAHFWIMFNFW